MLSFTFCNHSADTQCHVLCVHNFCALIRVYIHAYTPLSLTGPAYRSLTPWVSSDPAQPDESESELYTKSFSTSWK